MEAKAIEARFDRVRSMVRRELNKIDALKDLKKQYVVVGIRNPILKVDAFNDLFYLVHITESLDVEIIFADLKGTTLPGKHFLKNPMNPRGTACVKEGFYKDCWTYGYHRNDKQHPALKQVGYMRLVLDNNKNDILDAINLDTTNCKEVKSFANGYYTYNYYRDSLLVRTEICVNNVGINQHRTNLFSTPVIVGVHSAGCQVIQNIKDYKPYMGFVFDTVANNQSYVSYLLLRADV